MTGTENSHSAPPSPSHITNSKTKGVTAGHVRMAIPTSSSHQPLVSTATVAGRPQKNVTDPSATPGAQALAVLASVRNSISIYTKGVCLCVIVICRRFLTSSTVYLAVQRKRRFYLFSSVSSTTSGHTYTTTGREHLIFD